MESCMNDITGQTISHYKLIDKLDEGGPVRLSIRIIGRTI